MKISILGEEWTVEEKDDGLDFNDCDGYTSTEHGEKRIAIKRNAYLSKEHILRHELIHAFLFESGLGYCCEWAMNEEMVDFFARNWNKITKIFNEAEQKMFECDQMKG